MIKYHHLIEWIGHLAYINIFINKFSVYNLKKYLYNLKNKVLLVINKIFVRFVIIILNY
jgi:hypothetical protein